MIQVTDKYVIIPMPECYGVGVYSGIAKKEAKGRKVGDKLYICNWYYSDFEDALIKISKLIEKDALSGSLTLQQAVDRISALHLEMREYIKEAVRQNEH